MTPKEIIEEVKQLSAGQQIIIISAVLKSLRADWEHQQSSKAAESSGEYLSKKELEEISDDEFVGLIERLIVLVRNPERRRLVLQILDEIGTNEFSTSLKSSTQDREHYDFFKSAGLWVDRDITGKKLRHDAWRIRE